ncbi:MAG: AI-2E family transporter [Roseovarius sp.]|nr:AI-2E family transporter [Roseovarius sp.]
MTAFSGQILRVLAIIGLVLALWYFRTTVMLLFLAMLLAMVMAIPAQFLQGRGASRWLSLIVGVFLCFLGLLVVFAVVVPAVVESASQIANRYGDAVTVLAGRYDSWRTEFPFLPDIAGLQTTFAAGDAGGFMQDILGRLQNLGSSIGKAILAFVLAIFFLATPNEYRSVILALLPEANRERIGSVIDMIVRELRAWLRTLSLSIAVTVGLVFVSFELLEFPFAFEIAIFVGVATVIPTIGVILPIIPIVVFGLTAADPWIILVALPIYLLIQFVEGNFITPAMMKANLSILPAGILISQIIAAQIFGIIGVFLAVPMLVTLTVLVRELYCRDLLGGVVELQVAVEASPAAQS